MRICIPLTSNSGKLRKWVAKVSYRSVVAFYSVASTLGGILADIKEKADAHFPNLANMKEFRVDLRSVSLAEIDINEAFVIDFLVKCSPEGQSEIKIPPEITVPLQMTLCPVVDMYDEYKWLSDCRGILAKEEACFMANNGLLGPYSVATLREDVDGELVWDILSKSGKEKPLMMKSSVIKSAAESN